MLESNMKEEFTCKSRAQEDRLKLQVYIVTPLALLQAQHPTDRENDQSADKALTHYKVIGTEVGQTDRTIPKEVSICNEKLIGK